MTVATRKSRKGAKKSAARRAPVSGTKRVRRTREQLLSRIVEAATEEFKRYGYAATTTSAVAAKAGVTEAQLFRYFGSKATLFRETIFKPLNSHLANFLSQHLPPGADGREARDLYTSELQQFIHEHAGALTSLIFAETYDHNSGMTVSQVDSLRTYFERGAAAMRKRTQGKTAIDPDLFVRITFVTVLGCVMFKDWIFPRTCRPEDVRTAINKFITLAIEGNEVSA